MYMCLARGGLGGEGGKWMRGLGLGLTNHVGRGGVLDMCLYLGCGGVGGVCGELVGDLDNHPAGPHYRFPPQKGKIGPRCWGWEVLT